MTAPLDEDDRLPPPVDPPTEEHFWLSPPRDDRRSSPDDLGAPRDHMRGLGDEPGMHPDDGTRREDRVFTTEEWSGSDLVPSWRSEDRRTPRTQPVQPAEPAPEAAPVDDVESQTSRIIAETTVLAGRVAGLGERVDQLASSLTTVNELVVQAAAQNRELAESTTEMPLRLAKVVARIRTQVLEQMTTIEAGITDRLRLVELSIADRLAGVEGAVRKTVDEASEMVAETAEATDDLRDAVERLQADVRRVTERLSRDDRIGRPGWVDDVEEQIRRRPPWAAELANELSAVRRRIPVRGREHAVALTDDERELLVARLLDDMQPVLREVVAEVLDEAVGVDEPDEASWES